MLLGVIFGGDDFAVDYLSGRVSDIIALGNWLFLSAILSSLGFLALIHALFHGVDRVRCFLPDNAESTAAFSLASE